MIRNEVTKSILEILARLAPEIPAESIQPNQSLREQLELDSIDFLNFVIRMHQTFGIEIPESDYKLLTSVNDCVDYVQKAQPKEK
jgi:acyl carrier protein